ncbi:N-acetyltransferase family protein [Weissella paramesenteroides]|uniref:GNAT family N-acetyltransferase n=1 Tax=Weissella paramesenteroides TaxID=1249 RepID=UPI003F288233
MTINFKFATKDDLPKIVTIYNQVIKLKNVTADLAPIPVSDREKWLDASSHEKYPIWIITNDEQVIGWCSLEAFYGRAAYQHTAEISIYIDETTRGKHVGTQTIQFLATQLKQRDLQNIVAYVFRQNIPSMTLFKKQGFEQWGLLPEVAEIDGRHLDLAILGKHFD